MRTWRPAAGAEVRRFVGDIMARVQELAPEDQIGPRPTKEGAVDLTGGKMFLSNPVQHASLVAIVSKHGSDKSVVWDGRGVNFHTVIRILLRAAHTLHALWNQKAMLGNPDLAQYIESISLLHKSWVSLNWKPTVWLHWVCAHSTFYMSKYRSICSFTSIPTEHRHQSFKMDLRHAFEGWKFKNPHLTQRWLCRVVDLDALDQGLRLLSCSSELQPSDGVFERKPKRPRLH